MGIKVVLTDKTIVSNNHAASFRDRGGVLFLEDKEGVDTAAYAAGQWSFAFVDNSATI